MKLEINKQRLIGIAIIVVFLLIAIPFLLAGTTDSKDDAADSEVALKMPDAESTAANTATPATAETKDTDKAADDELLPEDETTDASEAKDAEKPIAASDKGKDPVGVKAEDDTVPAEENSVDKVDNTNVAVASETGSVTSSVETPSQTTVSTTGALPKTTKKATTTKNSNSSTKTKTTKTKSTTNGKSKKTDVTSSDPQTKTSSSAAENKYVWLVRVGYHVKPDASKDMLKKINSLGLEKVHVKEMKYKGQDVLNIFVGPMPSEKKANEVADKIEKKFSNIKVNVIKISNENVKNKATKTGK